MAPICVCNVTTPQTPTLLLPAALFSVALTAVRRIDVREAGRGTGVILFFYLTCQKKQIGLLIWKDEIRHFFYLILFFGNVRVIFLVNIIL